jgi:hypothetical protein
MHWLQTRSRRLARPFHHVLRCHPNPSVKTHPFTRPTVVAAVEFLGSRLSQAQFDQLIVRLGFNSEIALGPGSGRSVTAKSAQLGHLVTQRATEVTATLDGPMTLAEATVRHAVDTLMPPSCHTGEQDRFLRGLALDGYTVTWEENPPRPVLRASLPAEIDLPATDDELHQLLREFNFSIPLGHLDQAIDAHTRGDWAAANSQIRTFLEGLLSEIALRIDSAGASPLTAENRRQFLADRKFLSLGRNEWTPDGKNFINGLFKMLHTDGSHPGLSNEDHSTFRLHLALITGRTLLRRLKNP